MASCNHQDSSTSSHCLTDLEKPWWIGYPISYDILVCLCLCMHDMALTESGLFQFVLDKSCLCSVRGS